MCGSVKLTVQDYIATVVMDRPPVNAQNSEARQELITTFDSLTDRDDVRVAILTGTGRMFSAGADMKERPDPDHPGEPIQGNAYAVEHPKERALPRSLGEAAERLKGSAAARELFGDTFVEHYAATREWEEREARKAITDWQLARYFEII